MSDTSTEIAEAHSHGTIVIDLGKQNAKKVKALRKGKGKLLGEVQDAVAQLADEHGGGTVIVVVERKPRKMKMKWGKMGR